MNCYKHLPRYLKITFLLFTLQLITINLLAQSNSIKISPLNFIVGNTDLGYERMLKNKISLGGNLQFWFKETEGYSYLILDPNSYNVNRGLRGSIVLRKYFRKKENENRSSDFNYGLSIHYGNHYIKKVRSTNLLFGPRGYTIKYDTSIISGGIGFHFAYRLLFKDGFFTNFELIGRNSWVNKEGDDFPKVIKGISFQPRFQVGYRF